MNGSHTESEGRANYRSKTHRLWTLVMCWCPASDSRFSGEGAAHLFRALASRRPAPRLRPLQTLVMLPGTSVLLAHLLRQVDLEQ